MHFSYFFLFTKIIFDQKMFSLCWDKLDYPGFIVNLSCLIIENNTSYLIIISPITWGPCQISCFFCFLSWGERFPAFLVSRHRICYFVITCLFNFRTNPLGMKGILAKRYGDLMADLWSGLYRSIAPVKLRVRWI